MLATQKSKSRKSCAFVSTAFWTVSCGLFVRSVWVFLLVFTPTPKSSWSDYGWQDIEIRLLTPTPKQGFFLAGFVSHQMQFRACFYCQPLFQSKPWGHLPPRRLCQSRRDLQRGWSQHLVAEPKKFLPRPKKTPPGPKKMLPLPRRTRKWAHLPILYICVCGDNIDEGYFCSVFKKFKVLCKERECGRRGPGSNIWKSSLSLCTYIYTWTHRDISVGRWNLNRSAIFFLFLSR